MRKLLHRWWGKGVEFPSSPLGASVGAAPPPIPNAWTISAAIVDRGHYALSTVQLHDLLVRVCPTVAAGLVQSPGPAGPGGGAALRCQVALSHHLQQLVTYQPPSHYWPMQALETGSFLVAALALIGATVWRVGRRAARVPAVGEPRERTADPLALNDAPEIGVSPVRPLEDREVRRDATIPTRADPVSGLGFD